MMPVSAPNLLPIHMVESPAPSDPQLSSVPSSPKTQSVAEPSPGKLTTPHLIEIIEANLFVNVDFLLLNIISATKGPDSLIDWIELKPEFHGSLVKCALRLVSRHTATSKPTSVKEALFTFLVNLLNGRTPHTPFFATKKAVLPSSNNAVTAHAVIHASHTVMPASSVADAPEDTDAIIDKTPPMLPPPPTVGSLPAPTVSPLLWPT